jgi:hypothetical protein
MRRSHRSVDDAPAGAPDDDITARGSSPSSRHLTRSSPQAHRARHICPGHRASGAEPTCLRVVMAHHVSPGEQGYQFIGGELRPNFAPDGPARPAKMQVRMALSSNSLARRKSGVQIPSPPPPTLQVRASPASRRRRPLHIAAAARPQAEATGQPEGSQRPRDAAPGLTP